MQERNRPTDGRSGRTDGQQSSHIAQLQWIAHGSCYNYTITHLCWHSLDRPPPRIETSWPINKNCHYWLCLWISVHVSNLMKLQQLWLLEEHLKYQMICDFLSSCFSPSPPQVRPTNVYTRKIVQSMCSDALTPFGVTKLYMWPVFDTKTVIFGPKMKFSRSLDSKLLSHHRSLVIPHKICVGNMGSKNTVYGLCCWPHTCGWRNDCRPTFGHAMMRMLAMYYGPHYAALHRRLRCTLSVCQSVRPSVCPVPTIYSKSGSH